MAYIPDPWVIKRLDLAQSAQQILFYYCARADCDTGETNVSPEKTSQDLGIRKDHINEHDRKLAREGYISLTTNAHGGRIVRLLEPWQPRARRSGQSAQVAGKETRSQDLGKQEEQNTQNLGSPLDANPKLGEVTQNLGEVTQNLGEVTQNLGLHIRNNQTMNQTMNQRERARYDFNDLPFASESPEIGADTSGEQAPEQTQAAPAPFDAFKRQFPDQATNHNEAVIDAAGITDLVIWEATLTTWKINRYSVRNIAGMIQHYQERVKYAEQKSRQQQSNITRPRTQEEIAAYHAEWRRMAETRRADKQVANSRKRVQPALAPRTPARSDGRMANGAEDRTAKGMGPSLQFGPLIEAQKRIQQTLDSRRPAVRVEETAGGTDLECPF